MTLLRPGLSLSLRCVGDDRHPGNHVLDGDTVSGAVSLTRTAAEPFSGTRWYVVDDGEGGVALQCLGDIAGKRYLNGHTSSGDTLSGQVDLVPTLDGFTGTRWQAADDGADAVTLTCMGAITNPDFRFLDGRTSENAVGLAPSSDGDFTGTHWTLVDVVDHNTTPSSAAAPALTYGIDGPNVFGVAMAWTGLEGRINVQTLVGSDPPADVTMLSDTAIDRPALVVHNDRLHVAFTTPDGSIHVMASDDGHAFDTVSVLNVATRVGPGLASFSGHLVLAWADPGTGQIHIRDIDAGNQTDLDDTSWFAPALLGVPAGTTRDSALYLAWTGTDDPHSLNTRGADSLANLTDPNAKKTLPDSSIDGPALTWREDFNSGAEPGLVLGWTGRPGGPDGDTHLNIATSTAGVAGWDFKRTVSSTSSHGPALAYFNQTFDSTQGVLFTAWAEKPSLRIDSANYFDLPVIPT